MKIALVAQGYSNREFILDWFEEDFDEVWGVNSAAAIFQCTLGFRMDDQRVMDLAGDDPRYPMVSGDGLKRKNARIKNFVDCEILVPDCEVSKFDNSNRFPIEGFIDKFKRFFEGDPSKFFIEGSLPYMIGLALMRYTGEEFDVDLDIYLYGFDYTYDNSSISEEGKSSAAYWLAIARAEGAKIHIAKSSSLLANHKRANLNQAAGVLAPGRGIFYGYYTDPHLKVEEEDG